MNTPSDNKRTLEELHKMASPDWEMVPSAQRPAKLAVKMEAALRMVLLFHTVEPWNLALANQWLELQRQAGMDEPKEEATIKVLCNTIRAVLGE